MSAIAIIYTLITVTYGGQVAHSRGYETLYMCEQAKSLALTGMTIEQNKMAKEEQARLMKEAADLWRELHPARVPKTKEELQLVENYKRGDRIIGRNAMFYTVGEDGLIYDWPGTGGTMTAYITNSGANVQHAECVIEPPKE